MRTALTALLCAGLVLVSGCATYSQRFDGVEARLVAGDPAGALKALEQNRRGWDRDRVLYLLNKAMLQRMQGEYRESNASLEQAKRLIDELDAVSVSETTGSLTVNDTLRSYLGTDFERALLHLYAALNYLALGQRDAARVEALQVDLELQRQAEGGAAAYTEDAFVRYLNGLIFEELGEWSDAMIAYRKSYQAYRKYQKFFAVPPPHSLGQALLRLAEHLGLGDELRDYQTAFGIREWTPLEAFQSQGEVVLVLDEGLAPRKREEAVQTFSPDLQVMIRIAVPRYVPHAQVLGEARLRVDGQGVAAELVEDIDAIATKTLAEEMPAITARALARAVVKYRATKEAGKRDQGLGVLVNVAGMLSERADTRSWATLPQRIYLARQPLRPGRYDIAVQLTAHDGRALARKEFPGVKVEAGRKVYLAWRWISPTHR